MNHSQEVLDENLNTIPEDDDKINSLNSFNDDNTNEGRNDSLLSQEESSLNESDDELKINNSDEDISSMESQDNSEGENSGLEQENSGFGYSPEESITMAHNDSDETLGQSEELYQESDEQTGDNIQDNQENQSEYSDIGGEHKGKSHPSFGSSNMKHLYCPVCGYDWYSPDWDNYCPKSGCYGRPKPM